MCVYERPDEHDVIVLAPAKYQSYHQVEFNRLDPLGLKDTLFKGEIVQRDPDLASVTFTHRKQTSFGGFYWPSTTSTSLKAYRSAKYLYDTRRRSGETISNGSESEMYLNNINNFKRRFEAEADGRKMSVGAVVIIAAPIVGTAIGSSVLAEASLVRIGGQIAWRKYGIAFGSALIANTFQNGGDMGKIDAFDVGLNTLNPANNVSGVFGNALLTSAFDFNPFSENKSSIGGIGINKNIGTTAIDFTFGAFGGGVQYTFGSLPMTNLFVDAVTGSLSNETQTLTKDK